MAKIAFHDKWSTMSSKGRTMSNMAQQSLDFSKKASSTNKSHKVTIQSALCCIRSLKLPNIVVDQMVKLIAEQKIPLDKQWNDNIAYRYAIRTVALDICRDLLRLSRTGDTWPDDVDAITKFRALKEFIDKGENIWIGSGIKGSPRGMYHKNLAIVYGAAKQMMSSNKQLSLPLDKPKAQPKPKPQPPQAPQTPKKPTTTNAPGVSSVSVFSMPDKDTVINSFADGNVMLVKNFQLTVNGRAYPVVFSVSGLPSKEAAEAVANMLEKT